MIDLEPKHFQEIKRILDRYVHGVEVWAFGSRVGGRARKFSDLDIALVASDKDEKLDWRRIEALKDAFAGSDLPFIVDVLDINAVSEEFRKIIEAGYEVLREGCTASIDSTD
jgi:predicted nucleotidyltransferase